MHWLEKQTNKRLLVWFSGRQTQLIQSAKWPYVLD